MFSSKKIHYFSFILLLFVLGCQRTEKPATKESLVPAEVAIPGCTVGDARWFPMEEIPTNTTDQDIGLFLSTDGYPFMYDDCLCRVDKIKIPIAVIPEGPDPVLVEYTGTEELEPYVVHAAWPAFDTLMIVNMSEIYDPGLELMISLKGNNYNATLGNAGGLCIVDNLSGIYVGADTNKVFLEPWRLAEPPGTPFGDSLIRFFIPKAMTLPY